MANTKALPREERKKKKRAARKKNKELFQSLSKKERVAFLTQLHDKRAKKKLGIVSYVATLKKSE